MAAMMVSTAAIVNHQIVIAIAAPLTAGVVKAMLLSAAVYISQHLEGLVAADAIVMLHTPYSISRRGIGSKRCFRRSGSAESYRHQRHRRCEAKERLEAPLVHHRQAQSRSHRRGYRH